MSASARSEAADKGVLGIPSLEGFVGRSHGEPEVADGHMDLALVVPMQGQAVLDALKVMSRAFSESGVDVGMGALSSFHPRTFTFISSFPVMRDDRDANRRMRSAYLRSIEIAASHGWGQYRAHAAFMDLAMSAYSFNGNSLSRFHELIKDAVDPNGILSAGRYGIWPRHMRGREQDE